MLRKQQHNELNNEQYERLQTFLIDAVHEFDVEYPHEQYVSGYWIWDTYNQLDTDLAKLITIDEFFITIMAAFDRNQKKDS
jgi:hypothetical protein